MQSNIFLKMAPLLEEKKYNSKNVLIFLDEHYKSGEWIYPGVIVRETNNDIKDVYEILEKCLNQGIVGRYFDIYCSNCCNLTGERYSSFISIPKETFCPHCDNEITNCYEKAVIIYRVL